jgi:hypothetical protein
MPPTMQPVCSSCHPTSTTSPVERPALPDGQVYVNLRGPDGQLLQADDVLARRLAGEHGRLVELKLRDLGASESMKVHVWPGD